MKEKLLYACFGFAVCMLIVLAAGRLTPVQSVLAQSPGTGAGDTTVALGPIYRNLMPIVIVDSVDNSLMVYELDLSSTRWRLELKNTRTYRFDKQLRELNVVGPSVGEVRQRLQEQN